MVAVPVVLFHLVVEKGLAIVESPNVYQDSGQPLSQEVILRARMKNGFYQSLATSSTLRVPDSKFSADVVASLSNLTHINCAYLLERDRSEGP